ncbi:uncharacterized protein EKO05_0011237 [Ascochyta rabiei]|uniref:Uncharacterized protein n=1 Tax=Didymella rabiei TaxID=5454 RepID=A0A163E5J2_DIDRA|nr:uncharacterized protein EKO05_0011237 [Ascochyta rabiei]KZM23531.1 hypothetical protein ST47_g5324 [Ascochyta rabiei]UPX21031.1 hypothetical protein EKO05_0011237 [Ascochyta rabiei]
MAFFSKIKKAKEAAAEHKKEAATQEPQKPKVPYKHIPVHAAADALSATPTTIRAEDLRERIAAARRSRSMSSASANPRSGVALYQTVNTPTSRSRPSSIASSPTHSRNGSLGKRTNSDLSISTMMQSNQEAPSRGRQPARRDYFSHSSSVPTVPQLPAQHRPAPQTTISSRSSVTKRRSPLSAMSITEDDEAGEPSSSSSQASDGSVASSQSSTTEVSRPNSSQDQNKDINKEQNYSRPLSTIASAPVTPDVTPQSQYKHQSVIDVSSAQPEPAKKKSRFSLFSRKSMLVAAH